MFALSHPTANSNVREVALALLDGGLLDSFHTCIAACGGNFFDRLGALPGFGEVRRRSCAAELQPKLRLHPWREGFRLAARRFAFLEPVAAGFASIDEVYRALDRKVADYVSRGANLGGVYCYEDGALRSFQAGKKAGLACIYDLPIAYWRTVHRIIGEERERLPEWAPTLQGLKDGEEKLRRKEEEIHLADAVVCPSRFVEDSIPAEVRQGKRVFVVPFGSPTGPVGEAVPRNVRGKKLRVIFAGSMTQRKGLADVFAAMRLLDPEQFELHVLGSPVVEMDFYRRQFPGFIHHAGRANPDVLKLMAACDVFVLPSLVEGRALVMQEAMSCGLPLVITQNTGGGDLVEDGTAGFLVPIRSPEAIAEKLERLAGNRDLLEQMGKAVRAKARALSWADYRRQIVEVVSGSTRAA
jgi:glycosyltransferase involved in cell wall biosynthesis